MAHKYILTLALSFLAFNFIGCGPCGWGQEFREERYPSSSQIKYKGCVEKDSGGNNLMQGKWVNFSANGQKELEENYKDGMKHGLDTMWDENGQKFNDESYRDGMKHGLDTKWDENGQKISEENYKDGMKHGLGTVWYSNGQKFYEIYYKDGKQHGSIIEWYKNGQKRTEAVYKNGEMLLDTYKTWDETGKRTN
jgi:antitoxin component YwqK of YwqJK toxin-antitoxin module